MAAIVVTPVTVTAKAVLPKIIRSGLSIAPTVQVWVNFSGTEVNIAADARRVSISRGRSRERETMTPGRADIDLWNYGGKYDPDNYSSPYYPNIRPNKPVRIVAVTDTGTVPLFDGRLEGSTLNYAEGGLQPTVTWRAVDASKRLNRDRSTTGYGIAGEKTGARVKAVLDGATPTWPASERTLAPGTHTVQYAAGDQGRYDYLVQVAASEPGAFFIGADGKAVFRDANWAPAVASPALGSASDEYKFSSIEITDDESEIFNAVTVTANAVADQVEEDFSSQAEFGRSDLSVSSLLDTTANMDDLALTYLVAYSSPRRRVSRLKVDRVGADWYWFLSKELMDRVTVRHRPVYGGTFAQNSAIQGIQVEVNGSQDWELTWNLSPPLDIISNPNLLTDNQSSMETDATGWAEDPTVVNAGGNSFFKQTVLAGGTVPLVGTYCLEGRATGIPYISAGYYTTPYTTAPVTPTHTYRGSVWFRNYWGSMYGQAGIIWYNSGGTRLTQAEGVYVGLDGGYANGVTEWQQMTVEGVAPAGAAYARLAVYLLEAGVAYGGSAAYVDRPHYIDAAELRDTLVIASINPQPATIARSVTIPAPNILTTPQNRTVSVSTISRSVAIPTPTVTGGTSFVPTDISGLVAWYDFSDVATLWLNTNKTGAVSTDGELIASVSDKSGANHFQLQGTSGSRPTYKTAIINGKSVARFDGVGDWMSNSSQLLAADATQTIFVVAKKRSAAGSSNIYLWSFDSDQAAVETTTIVGTGFVYYANNAGVEVSLGGTVTNVNCVVMTYTSTSSAKSRINGGAGTSFDPYDSGYSVGTEFFLSSDMAASNQGDWDIAEVIIYNSTLSLTDHNRVGPYLATKWGFTWTTAT